MAVNINNTTTNAASSQTDVEPHALLRSYSLTTLLTLIVLAFAATPALAAPPVVFAPEGERAGEVFLPEGVAVDQSSGEATSGDVYVADNANARVDVFDRAGTFLMAFGYGVLDGHTDAFQTCNETTGCFKGLRGPGAGQLQPTSVAVDNDPLSAYQNIFVGEGRRVQEVTPSGEFVLMFGGDVNKTTKANLCTAANIKEHDVCGAGVPGTGPGEFTETGSEELPVAVDAEGHVWVGDLDRVEEFNAEGGYLGEVKIPGADQISALAVAPAGVIYTLSNPRPLTDIQELIRPASASFTLSFGGDTTAALPFNASASEIQSALEALPSIGKGNIHVESQGQLVERRDEVQFRGALESTHVEQLVPSGGAEVKTIKEGHGEPPPGVRRLEVKANVVEHEAVLDGTGHPRALGLDSATGNLFVDDNEEGESHGTIFEYDSAGAQIESFAAGQVGPSSEGDLLAYGDTAEGLYFSGHVGQIFALPPAGPLSREGGLCSEHVRTTSATLCATLNPEGAETHYHFEYVTEAQFAAHGFAGATPTAEVTLPPDFAEHAISAPLAGLSAEMTYRFCLLAKNAEGREGNATCSSEDQATFTTLPPALIEEQFATEVSSTSATLQAKIDPLGNASEYRFEYLTEASYDENVANGVEPFAGAQLAPSPDASLGAGEAGVSVSEEVQGLRPATAYRYRVLAHNTGGEARGAALELTTQAAGAAFALPDDRSWEMVSPPDKHGALIDAIKEVGVVQAAGDGQAITYLASAPTEATPQGYSNEMQVLSTRGRVGGGGGSAGNQSENWSSADIGTPHEGPSGQSVNFGQEYRFFSADLSLAVLQPLGTLAAPGSPASLSPNASEQTAFLRTDYPPGAPSDLCTSTPGHSCYQPLVTAAPGVANVPEETVFGKQNSGFGPLFVGASPDASHVILDSQVPLSEPAEGEPPATHGGLYEYSAGEPPAQQLQLVSVLPGGEPVANGANVGLGGPIAAGAVSSDGSRVVFTDNATGQLFLRDLASVETVQLDAAEAHCNSCESGGGIFQFASADGSRILFTDGHRLTADSGSSVEHGKTDLYQCEIVIDGEGKLHCNLTDLTPLGSGSEPAGVQGSVLGASQDGSYVYFVANGVQGGDHDAVKGACAHIGAENESQPGAVCDLYVYHAGVTRLVTILSAEDLPDWVEGLNAHTSRVSPDGRYLAFMSQRSLTGYDNADARSGRPDEEVFLYHTPADLASESGTLTCASCDPTGARPVGIEYAQLNNQLVGGAGVWSEKTWIAANIPGWTPYRGSVALYQSRYLSDSGRLLFNSSDGLVPQDVNEQEDVYEYEPAGVPAGEHACSSASTSGASTFEPAHAFAVEGRTGESGAGCVSLISSGASGGESAFLDASEGAGEGEHGAPGQEAGADVFFLTAAKLVPQDLDDTLDVYDAHECTSASPCPPPVAATPPECDNEASCKPSPTPQPSVYGLPSSATFAGPGNVTPPPTPPVKKVVKKTVKCKRNFVKKKVKNKEQCVKAKSKKKATRRTKS
jgi:hypothetical protein